MDIEGYLTTNEVCDLMHVNRATLYRWARADKLKPSSKVGRTNYYRKDEVYALLDPERYGNTDGER